MTQLEFPSQSSTFNLCMMTENTNSSVNTVFCIYTMYIATFKNSSPAPLFHLSYETIKGCTFFFLHINLIMEIGYRSVILAPAYLAVIRMRMSWENVGF